MRDSPQNIALEPGGASPQTGFVTAEATLSLHRECSVVVVVHFLKFLFYFSILKIP